MIAIAAVTKNRGIGKNGRLLLPIPHDLQRFKYITSGHIVIYGRKTLQSFPNKKPLKDRINIILSTDSQLQIPGAVIVNDINALNTELHKYHNKLVFVIGGESIYTQLLPYCDKLLLTHIDVEICADKYFPDISDEWEKVYNSEIYEYNNVKYTFCEYIKK